MVNSIQDSFVFPNFQYPVEERFYPVFILGGDRFCDWFSVVPPPEQLSTEYTFEMMKLSYEFGVRGFDISCRFNLIDAFKKLKEQFPEVIGIGNPNWLGGYKLNNTPLWEIKDQIIATIIEKFARDAEEGNKVPGLNPETKDRKRFMVKEGTRTLTNNEIRKIYIDKKIWLDRINLLRGVTDFCLVGADYADWMCAFDRLDLLRWQIESVRRAGMIPVSVSHWTSLTIPLLDKEDFGAHWVYANKTDLYLNYESATEAIKKASKPITAFRILSSARLPEEIEPIFQWLNSLGVKSFIFGLEKPEYVRRILPTANETLRSLNT